MKFDVELLLDVAMDLVAEDNPNVEIMLELLDSIPLDDFNAQTRSAIAHAQKVTAAALTKSSAYATLSRFALFRVVGLIEQHVAAPAMS